MRLHRIQVRNFRRIPAVDIEVRGNLVLVGPNDSGKSSILRALDFLLGATVAQTVNEVTVEDFTDPSEPIVFEAELRDFSDDERAAFPDAISVGPPERLRIRLDIQVDPADPELLTPSRTLPESGVPHSPTREQLAAIGWRFVPPSRSLERELGTGRRSVVQELLHALDLGDDQAEVAAAFNQMRDALDRSEVLKVFRGDLAGALAAALPMDVSKEDIQIVIPGHLEEDPLAGATIGLQRTGVFSRLVDQSDGIRSLSTLALLSIAHRGSNIVGIDEPETHLHPTACRSLGILLARDEGQRIVATHSSHLAARFAPREIVALGPDREARQLAANSLSAQAQFVARWWSSELIEPVTARRVILVEGPADRLLVEGAAVALGLSLDRLDISVVDLDGADNFGTVYRFLGPLGLGIPILGLCDEDHRVQWAAMLSVLAQGLGSSGIQVANPDLEGEYVRCLGPARVVELLSSSGLFELGEILRACGVTDTAAVPPSALADYCRKKKVLAAAAVGSEMNAADAAAVTSVAALLSALQ